MTSELKTTDMMDEAEEVSVLFVDDERHILSALQRLMLDEPCRVFVANSGGEALEILQRERGIGLIVSDQRMPRMTGVEFLEQARQVVPESLRILLTGYADLQETIDAINRGGAHRYIGKPWQDDELLQVIRDALGRYLLLQENRRLAAIVQRQNEELREWNERLKSRVLQQTAGIRQKNEELHEVNRRLHDNFRHLIDALAGLIEMASPDLRDHSHKVAELSVRIARRLGLPLEEVETIRIAALLHDIGELGDPERSRPPIDELAPDALAHYPQHAVRGQAALDPVEELRPAAVLIRHHHERYDGQGFPDRLQGEQIPLGARILQAADCLDRQLARSLEGAANRLSLALHWVEERLGGWVDPALFPLLREAAPEVYPSLSPPMGSVIRELPANRLGVGMILAADLFSGSGLLLLRRGTVLDEKAIGSIRRFSALDPCDRDIPVFLPRGESG